MSFPGRRLCVGVFVAAAAATLLSGYGDRDRLTGDDVVLATNRTVQELTGFISPSGNIGCYIDPASVRCDIRDRTWSPPPKPADCPDYTDYGQGIVLRAGVGASFVCAGDTALGGGPPLAYGDSITAGSIECTSKSSGMTCWDFQYGHEFTLSREGYQIA